MSLPDNLDPEWEDIAHQWVLICQKEGLTKNNPNYAKRANVFFNDLYMKSKQTVLKAK